MITRKDIFSLNEAYRQGMFGKVWEPDDVPQKGTPWKTDKLTPQDIYSFYYCEFLPEHEIKSEFLNDLKNKYITIFTKTVQEQLEKYYQRRRIDSDFDSSWIKSADTSVLDNAMKKTFRSDMKRRNDNWNFLTEYLNALNKSNTVKNIIFYVDRINNTIHNTGEGMLSKVPNGYELLTAFNVAAEAKLPFLRTKAYKDLRDIENVI